jgi:hypothetical protein
LVSSSTTPPGPPADRSTWSLVLGLFGSNAPGAPGASASDDVLITPIFCEPKAATYSVAPSLEIAMSVGIARLKPFHHAGGVRLS